MDGLRLEYPATLKTEHNVKLEDVEKYRATAGILVEDLMKRIAERDATFAGYKIVLSGSTREGVRVGNPYEIDFLIQFELNGAEFIEDDFKHKGFVKIKPSPQETRFNSDFKYGNPFPNEDTNCFFENCLNVDKILFQFLWLAHQVTATDPEYKKKPSPRLYVHIPFKENTWVYYAHEKVRKGPVKTESHLLYASSLRNTTNIGASLPCEILYQGNAKNGHEDHIDIVLSLLLKGYWPKCADGWREKYKEILDETLFKQIIEEGVSVVCKTPSISNDHTRRTYFRFSFSMAESAIFGSISEEQKKAYKLLKIIRELAFNKVILLEILDITTELKQCFPSYLLKTVCFSIVLGNKEKRSCREWLVLYLKQVISCLEQKSIKHHFIDDLELLNRVTVIYKCDLFLQNCIDQSYHRITSPVQKFKRSLRKFKSKYVLEEDDYYLDYGIENLSEELYDKYLILRDIFEEQLTNLPEDLTKLEFKCKPNVRLEPLIPYHDDKTHSSPQN